MKPIDQSDAHLEDRAFEIRLLKGAVVVFVLSLAAVFYPWQAILGLFGLGYVAYKFRYYRNRIGVYVAEELQARQDRLEYAFLGVLGAGLAVGVAIELFFPADWEFGGFLALPAVDFTTLDGILEDPLAVIGWLIVLAPLVALTYLAVQFRKRLLVGIDSPRAAIRATIWDALAVLPMAILWLGVFTARPIFGTWEFFMTELAATFELTPDISVGFAVLFGDTFENLIALATVTPLVVVGAYLALQHRKYGNATVPEVLGYRGVLPPTRQTHEMNLVVPIAVYLLFVITAIMSVDTLALSESAVLVSAVVAGVVGANVRGLTTEALGGRFEQLLDELDPVMLGVILGIPVLAVTAAVLGATGEWWVLSASYLILAIPLAFGASWVSERHALTDIQGLGDRLRADPETLDMDVADQVFRYTRARDNALRGTAIEELAGVVRATGYRTEDAIPVIAGAIANDVEDIRRSGLRALATVLEGGVSAEASGSLRGTDVYETVPSHLESEHEGTRLAAAESTARLFALRLKRGDWPQEDEGVEGSHSPLLGEMAADRPEATALTDAVVEYFARLWVWLTRHHPSETDAVASHRRDLLRRLLVLSEHASDTPRLMATVGVASEPAIVEEAGFTLAHERLSSDHPETRFLAAHVIRSSAERHDSLADPRPLLDLLEDESIAVRWIAAEAIAETLAHAPEHARELHDPLVYHLEEQPAARSGTAGPLLRSLARAHPEALIDHPTAVPTVAEYVVDRRAVVAEPAAALLRDWLRDTPELGTEPAVDAALRAGLTHSSDEVALRSLEAVLAIVADAPDAGTAHVNEVAEHLGSPGTPGVLAAAILARTVEAEPEVARGEHARLVAGLTNQTSLDAVNLPFMLRGSTVSAVTVDIAAHLVDVDPIGGEVLIEPLIAAFPAADLRTREAAIGILATLSREYPGDTAAAVEVAAIALDERRLRARRGGLEVLANVAAYHPDRVEPFVEHLVLATEDESSQVRSGALIALKNVCSALPETISTDIHRIIGRLDDDSATVRTHAGELIVALSERDPTLVEPAAETADRLRRLQRDPAVDADPARLQNASTAIQTGVPATELEKAEADEEEAIWSPETADEMGVSGDTKVFEPVGDDFDIDFEEALGEEDEGEEAAVGEVEAEPTMIEDEPGEAGDVGDEPTVVDTGETPAVDDRETAIEPTTEPESAEAGSDREAGEVDDLETVIEPDAERESAEGASEHEEESVDDLETVIEPDSPDKRETSPDVDELSTVIEPDGKPQGDRDPETDRDDVEDQRTVIDRDTEGSSEESDEDERDE